jgi:hypothetical protein
MNRFAMIAVLGLAACSGDEDKSDSGGTTDSGETDTDTGPGALEVTGYSVDCPGTTVTLSATTNQPGNDGLVAAQETASTSADGQFQDEHVLASNGTTMSVTLTTGVYPSEANVSTTFTCDGHYNDPNWMSYAFAAFGDDGTTIVDCLAGGNDAAGFIAGDYEGDAVGPGISPEMAAYLPNCVIGTSGR